MRHITITGATGVIGRRSVRELVAAGHRVTGVTRSARGRALLEQLGARAVEADVFDPVQVRAAVDGADTVVNLLTHVPAASDMADPTAWEENDRIRRKASAVIAAAAQDAGAQRLIQESVCFVYADGGDRVLDEDAPLAAAGVAAAARVAERNAELLFVGETVILRFGLFVGPDSGSTRAQLALAREGISAGFGRPDGFVPTVWLDDAAAAVAAAIDVPPGTYNVVDDDPPTGAELEAALAAVAGRPLRRRPTAAAPHQEPVARSLRLSNRRLRAASGWAPRVRAGRDGWRLIERERAAA